MGMNTKRVWLGFSRFSAALAVVLASASAFASSDEVELEPAVDIKAAATRINAYLNDQTNAAENFRHSDRFLWSNPLPQSDDAFHFPESKIDLGKVEYGHQNKIRHLDEFLSRSKSTGILVIKDGEIRYEKYFQGYDKESRATSFSVAKSFTSALIGFAVEDGLIDSVDDPVVKYLPAFKDSGFSSASIKDLLQMSSGIRFNESTAFRDAEVLRFSMDIFMGRPVTDITREFTQESEPGRKFHYASINTQVLGLILEQTTGMKVAEYASKKLWNPLGMEFDGYWNTDAHGSELTWIGLNMPLRDYAKFGMLYLQDGRWQGQQLLDRDWVAQSTLPNKPYLMRGKVQNNDLELNWGYQYQWWLPKHEDEEFGDYSAIGLRGQYVYVNPKDNVVIVKTSADGQWYQYQYEHMLAFRAISRALRDF